MVGEIHCIRFGLATMYSKKMYYRIINSMVYYGLALNISTFSGDVFLNNALAGAPIEITACFITTALLYLGRKPALYLSLFFCGACLAATPWISEGEVSYLLYIVL